MKAESGNGSSGTDMNLRVSEETETPGPSLKHLRAPDGELLPTRWTLLSRLKNVEDQESWRDFFNLYWKLIYGVALKSGLGDPEAQEVVQETVLTVAKKIQGFHTDPAAGSFKSWLLHIIRWRIADQVRKQQRQRRYIEPSPDDSSRTPLLERFPDPAAASWEDLWNQEWEKNLVDAAMQRIRRQIEPKQYQIFDLYVVKQWPVREVATSLKVSVGQVYLAKHRVSQKIKTEIKALENEWQGAGQ